MMDTIACPEADRFTDAGWQPIATAPRDGTPVLVELPSPLRHEAENWPEEAKPQKVTIAAWSRVEGGWVALNSYLNPPLFEEDGWGRVRSEQVYPERWMPLPVPADAL